MQQRQVAISIPARAEASARAVPPRPTPRPNTGPCSSPRARRHLMPGPPPHASPRPGSGPRPRRSTRPAAAEGRGSGQGGARCLAGAGLRDSHWHGSGFRPAGPPRRSADSDGLAARGARRTYPAASILWLIMSRTYEDLSGTFIIFFPVVSQNPSYYFYYPTLVGDSTFLL